MKLQFKQQPYQTDATMAVVRCFEGQSKGFRKGVIGRTFDEGALPGMEVKVEEIFSNKKLELFLVHSSTIWLPKLPKRRI